MEAIEPKSETKEDRVKYWNQEGEALALDLYRYLKELSTKIPIGSKTQSLELVFLDRKIRASEWQMLRVSLVFLVYHPVYQEIMKKPLLKWVFREFSVALNSQTKRFNRTKFCNFVFGLEELGGREKLKELPREWIPASREWRENYSRRVPKVLRFYFKLRGPSRKKARRQERVRGYRDHGGASSVSERARRQANTSYWNEYLQEVLEYVQESGVSIEIALKVFKMDQRRE